MNCVDCGVDVFEIHENACMTTDAVWQAARANELLCIGCIESRAVKRIIRPMLGFKWFRCARVILGGIEIMHMIRKEQMRSSNGSSLSAAQPFYSLAA